ncbi:MAG: hypothetical protein ACTHN3_15060 [Solirubrobacterales bacterium]
MKKPLLRRNLIALLPLALLLLLPGAATAADIYEASWDGGHLTASANADFTEATIESVETSFDQCGTQPNEVSCAWGATVTLHSNPETRCNPATPEDQIVWESGEETDNGTITDGPVSFPLEGCRGQSLVLELWSHKTYEESTPPPWIVIKSGSIFGLFTFGYHPVEEADRAISTEYNPPEYEYPPFQPNITPAKTFALSADCGSLQLNSTRYAFAFHRLGCYKAGKLARARYFSGGAPKGFVCQNLLGEGVRCWRRHRPAKFFEWHLPRSRS